MPDIVEIRPEDIGRHVRRTWGFLFIFFLAVVGTIGTIVYFKTVKATEEIIAGKLGLTHTELIDLIDTRSAPFLEFWSGKIMREETKYGLEYLVTDNLIPVRAIAGSPDVKIFETKDKASAFGKSGAVGIMQVWYPYFLFDRTDNAALIGRSLNTPDEERRWVPIGLCICWTTRECLSLERGVLIYKSLEDAKEGKGGKLYTYAFKDHFIMDPSRKDVASFHLAALPVIQRVDKFYWRVARPDIYAGKYETCWIKWDGKDSDVVLRFRTTRQEYTRYINGLWSLRTNIREKEGEFLGKAVDWVTAAELSGHSDHSTTRKRLNAVPLIGGTWLGPPETIEELGLLKKKLNTALRVDSAEDLWDCTDTAYLTPDLVF